MTLEQFIAKWLGKTADHDGFYGGQCVDLFRFYVDEVLGFPQPAGVAGARDFWSRFDRDPALFDYYDKIPNSLTAVPQRGDVVIWGAWTGNEFGHVAIFLEGNVLSFKSLDQNYPTLSEVTITSHNYLTPKVLGWLRPKGAEMDWTEFKADDDIPGIPEERMELKDYPWYDNHWTWLQLVDFTNDRWKDVNDLKAELEKLREDQIKVIGQLNNRIRNLETEYYELKQEYDKCRSENLEHLKLGDFLTWVGIKLGIK